MERENVVFCDFESGCDIHTISVTEDSKFRGDHFHDEAEIISVKKGSVACWIDGEKTVLSKGKILVIGSRVIHRLMYECECSEVTYIQADVITPQKNLLQNPYVFPVLQSRGLKKSALFDSDSPMQMLFAGMKHELESPDSYHRIAIRGYLYQLIALMCRAGMISTESELKNTRMIRELLPVLAYADSHFSEKITLDEVCKRVSADKYYFCKKFRRATGTTFFDYLGSLRLKKAEELLITTEKSVTEIAGECGFSSLQYFNRFFADRIGYSPTAYRKMSDART